MALATVLLVGLLAACGGGDGSTGDAIGGGSSTGDANPSAPSAALPVDTSVQTPAPTPTPTPTPPPSAVDVAPAAVASYAARATELAGRIVQATTQAVAVDATAQVLVDAGVRVYGGSGADWAAREPAASWTIDRATVFNLAAEARDRAVSGRLTLAQTAQMWADFGFPFAGTGTPGEQLLAYLRVAVVEGRAQPAEQSNFVPLFIAAMTERQDTPADIANAATRPEDVRLTLLEIELLHAMFDRAFTLPVATSSAASAASGVMRGLSAADERRQIAAVSDGLCAEMKKFYGSIGGKALEKGLQYTQGKLTESALAGLGMTKAEIGQFAKYGKIFGALSSVLKFVKLAQIYAAGQATLTIEGPNPVRKPAWQGARKLVPVKATAGVPDAAWQEYQKNNGSEAYQSVKSCLGILGAPAPLDIKDIAQKAAGWRVSWELTSGKPLHALIETDVNVFDASFNGNPYTMKLAQAGVSAAEATLKVDIREESQLASLFQGPILSAPVRVRARVQTVEPPSPAVLIGIVSLAGTVGSLVDLGVGWIQAMIPPTSSTTITVEDHGEPQSFDATFRMAMTFDAPHIRGGPTPDRHTIGGDWSGPLKRSTVIQDGTTFAYFSGNGNFVYSGVSTASRVDEDRCTTNSTWALRNGAFQMNLGPPVNAANRILPNEPEELGLGGGDVPISGWPTEQRTMTVACPDADVVTFTSMARPEVFVAAANAMNLQDARFMTSGSPPRVLVLKNGKLLADGTLELTYTTPLTVTLFVPGSGSLDTVITSQNNVIRLKPVFAPPVP